MKKIFCCVAVWNVVNFPQMISPEGKGGITLWLLEKDALRTHLLTVQMGTSNLLKSVGSFVLISNDKETNSGEIEWKGRFLESNKR
ncbi:hypothetical protein CEXT_460481 [Caerostris extrusa]|uniref:Uncharacterized protein n=1 Tax=Caerostris extrusa TaxID=172846 RepID=A0AAV4NMR7_CAEEX|nr:hypothetical protein CEXT_460481 [Caerostris extrusa]